MSTPLLMFVPHLPFAVTESRIKRTVKPTTKDLARAAGVSLATIDRVLNDRPGVTFKTKSAVEEAIQKLGRSHPRRCSSFEN